MIKQIYPEINCTNLLIRDLENALNNACKENNVQEFHVKSRRRNAEYCKARYDYIQKAVKICDHGELITSLINRDRSVLYHYLNDYIPNG